MMPLPDPFRFKGKLAHFCPDWDYMAIDETWPEFESCICDRKKLEQLNEPDRP